MCFNRNSLVAAAETTNKLSLRMKAALFIDARTGPAGPAMAGPFSAEVETKFPLVWSHSQTEFRQSTYVSAHACIRLTFSMAKLPDLPGEPQQPVLFPFLTPILKLKCNESAS